MKILVTAKRVVDPDAKIKLLQDGSGLDVRAMNFCLNPFDEVAVEEALRMRAACSDGEVVAVGIGGANQVHEIRRALSMGADRGLHVLCELEIDPSVTAEILMRVCEREKPDIVLLGKQSSDTDCGQVPQRLAGLLGLPQACFASKIELGDDLTSARVTREVDGGREILDVRLPAVISVDLCLNEPRAVTMAGVMAAKKKKIEEWRADALGLELGARAQTVELTLRPRRPPGIRVADARELAWKLKNEAGVI